MNLWQRLAHRINRLAQLLCRHEWVLSRFQSLGPGTSFRCIKCGKYHHV